MAGNVKNLVTAQRRSQAEQDDAMRKLFTLLPKGEKIRTSVKEMAAILDVTPSFMQDINVALDFIGAKVTSFGGHPSGKGKVAFWTRVMDFQEAREALTEKGIDFSSHGRERINALRAEAGNPHPLYKAPPVTPEVAQQPEKVIQGTTEEGTRMAIAGPDAPRTLHESLVEVRREVAQPEALLAAVRQYAARDQFIEQEVKRFAEMGIELKPETLKVRKDPRMEAVLPLLPYVDSLERKVQNFAKRIDDLQKQTSGAGEARHRITQQAEHINRLVKEKGALDEQLRKERTEHIGRLQEKDREIRRLQTVADSLKQMNGTSPQA